MKKITWALAAGLLGSQANAMTSKEKALWTVGGSCTVGAAAGAYADSNNHSESKSSTGTIATSALAGCLTGALFSYFFMDDDQAAVVAEAQRYKFEADQLRGVVRQGNYDGNLVKGFDPLQAAAGAGISEDFNFEGLREEGCYAREFSLGVGEGQFVAVSKNIIMPRLTYWVLVSKDRDDCVKPDKKTGYLEYDLPGIGKSLLDRAETEAKKLKGMKK